LLLARQSQAKQFKLLYFKEKIKDETRQNNDNSVQRNEKEKKICSKNTCISIAFFAVAVKFMTSFKHIRCFRFYNRAWPFK